jgi:hypothetical protein
MVLRSARLKGCLGHLLMHAGVEFATALGADEPLSLEQKRRGMPPRLAVTFWGPLGTRTFLGVRGPGIGV